MTDSESCDESSCSSQSSQEDAPAEAKKGDRKASGRNKDKYKGSKGKQSAQNEDAQESPEHSYTNRTNKCVKDNLEVNMKCGNKKSAQQHNKNDEKDNRKNRETLPQFTDETDYQNDRSSTAGGFAANYDSLSRAKSSKNDKTKMKVSERRQEASLRDKDPENSPRKSKSKNETNEINFDYSKSERNNKRDNSLTGNHGIAGHSHKQQERTNKKGKTSDLAPELSVSESSESDSDPAKHDHQGRRNERQVIDESSVSTIKGRRSSNSNNHTPSSKNSGVHSHKNRNGDTDESNNTKYDGKLDDSQRRTCKKTGKTKEKIVDMKYGHDLHRDSVNVTHGARGTDKRKRNQICDPSLNNGKYENNRRSSCSDRSSSCSSSGSSRVGRKIESPCGSGSRSSSNGSNSGAMYNKRNHSSRNCESNGQGNLRGTVMTTTGSRPKKSHGTKETDSDRASKTSRHEDSSQRSSDHKQKKSSEKKKKDSDRDSTTSRRGDSEKTSDRKSKKSHDKKETDSDRNSKTSRRGDSEKTSDRKSKKSHDKKETDSDRDSKTSRRGDSEKASDRNSKKYHDKKETGSDRDAKTSRRGDSEKTSDRKSKKSHDKKETDSDRDSKTSRRGDSEKASDRKPKKSHDKKRTGSDRDTKTSRRRDSEKTSDRKSKKSHDKKETDSDHDSETSRGDSEWTSDRKSKKSRVKKETDRDRDSKTCRRKDSGETSPERKSKRSHNKKETDFKKKTKRNESSGYRKSSDGNARRSSDCRGRSSERRRSRSTEKGRDERRSHSSNNYHGTKNGSWTKGRRSRNSSIETDFYRDGSRREERTRRKYYNKDSNGGEAKYDRPNDEYEWQFENEHGNWITYGQSNSGRPLQGADVVTSDDIEIFNSEHRGTTKPLLIEANDNQYVLDLLEMSQTNLKTKVRRRIRRVRKSETHNYQNQSYNDAYHYGDARDYGPSSSNSGRLSSHRPDPQDNQTARKNDSSNKIEWQFEDDTGNWITYGKTNSGKDQNTGDSSTTSDDIEKYHARDPTKASMKIRSGREQYILNFAQMTEVNIETLGRRRVRRVVKAAGFLQSLTQWLRWGRPSSSGSKDADVDKYEWQFQDEHGVWITYGQASSNGIPAFSTAASSDDIETYYSNSVDKAPISISSRTHTYVLDFNSMTQVNQETFVKRHIRRVKKNSNNGNSNHQGGVGQSTVASGNGTNAGVDNFFNPSPNLANFGSGGGNVYHSSTQGDPRAFVGAGQHFNSRSFPCSWQFQDENGTWITYGQPSSTNQTAGSTTTSDDIEQYFLTNPGKTSMVIQSPSNRYVLDKRSMVQINMKTQAQKPVRKIMKQNNQQYPNFQPNN